MLKNATFLILGFCLCIVQGADCQTTQPPASRNSEQNIKARFNLTVSGRITDSKTGESMPFATVYVKNGDRLIATKSNVDGFFTLTQVPSDTSSITLTYVGYRNTTYALTPESLLTSLNIAMKPDEAQLDEVTVKGEKTEIMKANETISMIKMTPKNLAKLPNVGERDPFRAFQLMPGVSASNESSSGLYVRGGTPDQTLVLYDGFTVYHVDHLFGFFSAFNYNALKDIQLYKGGFDAKFGGRISAVAEITGKEGNQKQFNAGADLSLLSANAFIETPLGKKVSFLTAARRSWKGPLYKKIFNRFSSDSNTGTSGNTGTTPTGGFPGGGGGFGSTSNNQTASSYFYDLNAKLTYRPGLNDNISLSLYNGTDNMDNSSSNAIGSGFPGGGFGGGQTQATDLNTDNSDVSNWGNLGSSLKWSRRWGPKLYSNTMISYSNYYSDRDNSRSINITRSGTTTTTKTGQFEHNDLNDATVKTDFEWKVSSNQQVEFGGQHTQNRVKYTYSESDTVTVLSRDDRGSTSTFYVQDQISLLDGQLQIKPGIRLTYFDVTGKTYTEPRLSVNYNLTDKFKLKGAAGTYYQFVKQINREDISQGNRNFWILSDGGSLPVTKSNHLIIGGSYETPKYLFDVEFYNKDNTGITEYTLRFVPKVGQGLTADQTFYNGKETIRGMDLLVQRKFGAFTGWVGYTLAEAQRNIAAFSDKPYYSDQDVRHQLKLVGSYHYQHWDFAATWIYSTGRPYTSIIGGYQLTLLDGSTRDFTNPSDKNANRFPNYHRMDASVTYTFNSKWNIGVSVFNLYNRTNVWYKRYQIVKESDINILQTTNVTYLGITPNLTISWHLK